MTNAEMTRQDDVEKVVVAENAENPGFLGRLRVNQKLSLLALTLAVPTLFLLGNLLFNEQRQSAQVRRQLIGQSFLEPLSQVQNDLRTAGVPALSYLSGNDGDLDRYKTIIGKAFTSIDNAVAVAEKNDDTDLANKLRQIRTNYDPLYKATLARSIPATKYTTDSAAIIGGQLAPLFDDVAVRYRLNFMDDELSRNLAQFTTSTLASRLPRIGASFGVGINTAAAAEKQNGKLSDVQKVTLEYGIRDGEAAQRDIASVVTAIGKLNVNTSEDLKNKFDALAQATADNYKTIRSSLIDSPTAQLSSGRVRQMSFNYLPVQYAAYSAANAEIGRTLSNRLSDLNKQFYLILAASLAIALLVAWLISVIARSIVRPLGQLTAASQRLASGDLAVHVPVTTSDEFGLLTNSFNDAATQLRSNAERVAQERIEQQRLQNNIGDFLDVTMDIAEGDLTKRGRVTEDVLGNVVDSINLMTEELASVLKDVQNASTSVATGSGTMIESTRRMTQGTEQVVEEATRVSSQVQSLITDIRQMAQSAQQSADTARLALQASQQGQAAVTDTLEGMQTIRREVQTISKRIKGLGDRSLEIQEIVDTISQIADQTNLLAVNASIEAVGAGEAGSRFAIVADEVRKLADTSSQATGRIANLIKSIQTEVQDVIVNVEESTREVEQGYRVAGTAGERLREIGSLTEQSAQLAEQISEATTQQVRGVEQMGQAVQQITEISGQAGQAVREGEAVAEQLQQLAQRLDGSLRRFRLPS